MATEVGICYGQNLNHGSGVFPATIVRNNLQYWYDRGCRHVRIAQSNFLYVPGVNFSKQAALIAKEIGYTWVIWGAGTPGGQVLATIQPGGTYYNAIIPLFQWAEANGIDEVHLDNEPELHFVSSIPREQIRVNFLENMLPLGREHAPSCKISITSANNNWQYWLAGLTNSGGDSLDSIGLQLYGAGGSTSNFDAEVKQARDGFGDKAQITEWHMHASWGSIRTSLRYHEWLMKERLMERLLSIHRNNIVRTYAFCGKWDDTVNQAGVQNDMFAYMRENDWCTEGADILSGEFGFGQNLPDQWLATY